MLAPGSKLGAGNMASWVVIMEALSRLVKDGPSFQLILATHPGDQTPIQLYHELVSFSPVPTTIVSKDVFTTSDMVSGADIIVEFGSSIGINGAYQSVPVVSLGFEVLFRRFEQVSGSRMSEAVKDGLSELVVADPGNLTETIRRLLTPEGFAPMLAKQQKLCPMPPERGVALRNIAEVIAKFAT